MQNEKYKFVLHANINRIIDAFSGAKMYNHLTTMASDMHGFALDFLRGLTELRSLKG